MENRMGAAEAEYMHRRSRSVAVVVRDGKILMEKVFFFGRTFYTLPGGGIEKGETPEEAALRELKEECGLDGTVLRPLAILKKQDGGSEYSYEVSVPADAQAQTGCDPEYSGEDQPLKEVLWMGLEEISERDRAFLWSYGLLQVDGFFETVKNWSDEISCPGTDR